MQTKTRIFDPMKWIVAFVSKKSSVMYFNLCSTKLLTFVRLIFIDIWQIMLRQSKRQKRQIWKGQQNFWSTIKKYQMKHNSVQLVYVDRIHFRLLFWCNIPKSWLKYIEFSRRKSIKRRQLKVKKTSYKY